MSDVNGPVTIVEAPAPPAPKKPKKPFGVGKALIIMIIIGIQY